MAFFELSDNKLKKMQTLKKNYEFENVLKKGKAECKGGIYMSLICVSDLSFTYEGSYEPIFENVSFQIDTDWKLGFTGRNGRGKTTLLNLLQGK